jgi:hypothetical protein
MISNYKRDDTVNRTGSKQKDSTSGVLDGAKKAFPPFKIPSANDYVGYGVAAANPSQLSSIAGGLMNGANALQNAMASSLNTPGLNLNQISRPENEDAEKNPKPMKEDGMLVSLVKIILGVLTIPAKFGTAFMAILNATAGITLSAGGIVQIVGIALFHLANIFKVSVEIVIRHVTTLTDLVIKLPKCFLVHIIKMIFAVLYLMFPLSSFVVWSFTGVSLMPAFEWVFNMLDEGDNWISDNLFGDSKVGKLYLLKFPAEITKYCYYCNGKPYRLNDIIDDLSKVGDTGKKFSNDVQRKAMPTMKPAVPFILRTKRLVDKLMK